MKKSTKSNTLFFSIALLFLSFQFPLFAQYTVDFEGTGETKTGYASGNVTLNGISWNLTEALIGTSSQDYKVGSRSLRIRQSTGAMTMLANKTTGIGTISFKYRRYDTDAQSAFKVQYSINDGVDWNNVGSEFTGTDIVQTFSQSINISGNIRIRIIYSSGTAGNSRRLNIDDITMTDYAATPIISSSGTLSALSTSYGTSSSNTSFSLSGANMTAGISVNPPAGFQVSTTSDFSSNVGSNGSPITVGAAGTIASTTVYVRLASTTVPGSYSGNIVLSSSGATNVNVATVSSTVNTKALTISGLTGANKVYDANTTASSTGTPSLVGIVGGDVVTLSGSPSLMFANANVGTAKAITVTGYTLSGAQAARYTLTQPTGLTGDITSKSLTITADGVTKTAGSPITGGAGSTAFSSSGLVGGQTIGSVTIAYGSAGAATGDGATHGVYPNQVTASAATGGTFTASNYSITYVSGSITVEAAPASPTISVSGTLDGLSTTYGTPSSTTNFTVSGAAMTTGITITPPTGFEVATTSDFSTSIGTNSSPLVIGSAGTIASTTIYVRIRAVATVAGSPYSGNITLTSTGASTENIATVSSTVSTKSLTISGLSASNRVYNATTSVSVTGTASYVGLANGESFSVSGSPTFAFATKTVGTAKTINQTGSYVAPSTNYTVTQPTLTADITAKTLTTSGASAQNKVYDATTTATITGTSLVGVESGDVVSVSGGGTFASANVGSGISVTSSLSLSGADAGNYTLTQPSGLTANISKANQTITFGAIPAKSTTDVDFNPGATASSGLLVTYSSSNTSVAVIVGGLVDIIAPGTSIITASQAGNSNYNSALSVDQTLTVTVSGYYWNGGSTVSNPANGGTGTWGTSNAWRQPTATGSQATWANGSTGVLAGTAGVISLAGNYTFSTLYVNTTNYTISSSSGTTRTLTGDLFLANNVNLKINDISTTASRLIEISGNVSGGTDATLTINVNQTGSNTSRINLSSNDATISIPILISAGSTSSNYGNVAIVGTASNTAINETITNNTNFKTTIGSTSGNSIVINEKISGSADLMFAAGSSGGAGTITLNAENDYSGSTIFNAANSGVILLGIDNALPTTTDVMMANSTSNGGILDLNGKNQEIASLTNGAGGGSIRNNGVVSSTLTISGASTTTFGLVIADGAVGLSLTRSGSGTTELTATNTYTGLTTVSGGTLRFNKSGGTTIPVGNNVTINGGTLRISSNQTLNNVSVTSGTLRVDAGVTLTINGTFTGGGTIENNGTIVIVGPSAFPGSSSTVTAMNNLTINRAGGVSLDNSIEITGTLTLTSGTLTVGSNTLTLSGTYPSSNSNNILTTASSTLVFNCTGSGPFTLPNFTALGGLTINSSGQNYNLNSSPTISGNLTLTNGTLVIGARTLTYSGASISRTSGVMDASNASSSLIFTNSSSVSIPSGTFTSAITSLVLNSNGVINLQENTQISTTLTMTSGNIQMNSGFLEIGSSSSTTGSINWTAGTVVGPMKRWFGTAANSTQASGIFPVGTADQNRLAVINFTGTTDGGYIVMDYKTGTPTVLDEFDNPVDDPFGLPLMYTVNGQRNYIQNADLTGYWDITPYSSADVAYGALDNNNFDITLRINSDVIQNNPVTANPPGMRIIRAKGNPSAPHDPFEIGATAASISQVAGSDTGTDFLVRSNGLQGFSWFNIGGDNETPLPVELLSFNGYCENEQVKLAWTTASENNSSYFEVLKSQDGENWNVVNSQAAAGFSTELQMYSFVDFEKSNAAYYRLNQVDFNGDHKLYDAIFVDCENESDKLLTFPNPSKNGFNITLNDTKLKGDATLVIRDAMGKVVIEKSISVAEGINLYPISSAELENGIYFITIANEHSQTKTIKHSKN
ncbi:MAG: T9SS type A sorting domain-containing protein [Flavobacteriales bacterium]|nr:T9SS type A sorting domain-containing protein [Flavobacteriales bacterium]